MSGINLIGKTLRGYELIDRIGAGGYGAVYRARQQIVGREVAVKVILPQYANAHQFVRRFEAEAQFIARLEHPHIVPLFDYWRDPEGAYLVMRYISGGNLTVQLQKRTFTLDDIARFLDQITAALSVAHRSGVVHLDLKPDNILFDDDDNAYLTDFGIARSTATPHNSPDTPPPFDGTAAYASPEQIQGIPPTPQVDIYSLGIILYELLTGLHPYGDLSSSQLIMKQLTEPLPNVQAVRPDLPLAFNDIIQRCTAKDPTQRYRHVRQVAAAFQQAQYQQTADMTGTFLAFDPKTTPNPYKGLRPFDEADAGHFFGREDLVAQLVGYLSSNPFLAVVGPSGSGKSSLLKAGIIPAIRRGAITNSHKWFIADMVPSVNPINALAEALNSMATRPVPYLVDMLRADTGSLSRVIDTLLLDADGDILLVIDQFEEVFTQVKQEPVRRHFMGLLRQALRSPNSRLRVVIALRADFYDRPLQYEGFGTLIQTHTQVVLPLSITELERAIIGPAEQIGVQVDADLIATMIGDVRQEPGALPLLQYALTEVFERREGDRLTLAAYEFSGGVSGALAKRAEDVYSTMDPAMQSLTQQMFMRLVTLGEGTEDTRRRSYYSELQALGSPERVQRILEAFGKHRLLTFDTDPETREPLVEVAHEALIREWQRLLGWVAASRSDIRLQRLLHAAATEWVNADLDPSFLLRGSRLAQYEEWATETTIRLTDHEQAFLDASTAERQRLAKLELERAERERLLEVRARQRLQLLVVVMGVMTLLSAMLLIVAIERNAAEREARATSEYNAAVAQTQAALAEQAEAVSIVEAEIAAAEAARAQSLALSTSAQLRLSTERDLAATLALEANQLADPPLQSRLILARVAYSPGTIHRFATDSTVNAVAMSADGQFVLSGGRDNSLTLWDAQAGEVVRLLEGGHRERITDVALNDDATRALTGSWDDTAIVWDVANGAILFRLEGHTDNVESVDISDDQTRLLTAGSDGTVRVWDANSGELQAVIEFDTPLNMARFSPSGRQVAIGSTDDRLLIWDLAIGRLARAFSDHDDEINAIDFSADGRRVLSAASDGTVRLREWSVGGTVTILHGHADRVTDAVLTEDERFIFSVDRSGEFIVWNAATGEQLLRFTDHSDTILSVAASHDGRYAVTGSNDDSLRVWVIGAAEPLQRITIGAGTAPQVMFTPDGYRWLVGATGNGMALYEANDDYTKLARTLDAEFINVTAIAISPDGRYAASGTDNHTVAIWNLQTGVLLGRYRGGHTAAITSLAFTADSTQFVSGALDASVVVWDVATGDILHQFRSAHEDGVLAVATHPTEPYALSGSNDGSIIIWDIANGREWDRLLGNRSGVYDLVYTPDGQTIYGGLDGGAIQEWRVGERTARREFEGHRDTVRSLALSPDGQTLLSGGEDNELIVWDVASGAQVQRFPVDTPVSLSFAPDGMRAISGSTNGEIALWQIIPLDNLPTWVQANRYIADLPCDRPDISLFCE